MSSIRRRHCGCSFRSPSCQPSCGGIVPLGSIVLLMAHWRPAPWTWPLMALSILWPQTPLKVITGNPGMWIAAAVALGLRYGGPGALILLKPSFAPLALIGIRHRSWWLVAGGIALASLPFETLNLTYLSTILDARGQSILYSLPDLPLTLIPLVAWAGRQR